MNATKKNTPEACDLISPSCDDKGHHDGNGIPSSISVAPWPFNFDRDSSMMVSELTLPELVHEEEEDGWSIFTGEEADKVADHLHDSNIFPGKGIFSARRSLRKELPIEIEIENMSGRSILALPDVNNNVDHDDESENQTSRTLPPERSSLFESTLKRWNQSMLILGES